MQNWAARSCAVVAYLVAVDGLSLGGNSEPPPPVAPNEGGLQAEPAPFAWDGRDDGKGEYLSYDLRPDPGRKNDSMRRKSAEDDAKVFVLLGPQDSGTNLMSSLILNNFAGLKNSHNTRHIWKHTANGAAKIYDILSERLKHQTLGQTSAIMIIRSPLSQIVSWRSHPYDMQSCTLRPYERMNESCHMRGWQYNSTLDVYNQYAQQYRQIEADGKFMHARLFSYEDVVLSTEDVIRDLAKLLGKPVPDVMHLADRSCKGGEGIGRMQAREKIENRLYLNGISPTQQAIMCQGLDYDRADMIEEGSYFAKGDPKRKPHSYDCRAHRLIR